MALEMIKNLCGKDSLKWDESISAAQEALQKRIGLWDGINHQINKKKKSKYEQIFISCFLLHS